MVLKQTFTDAERYVSINLLKKKKKKKINLLLPLPKIVMFFKCLFNVEKYIDHKRIQIQMPHTDLLLNQLIMYLNWIKCYSLR